MTTLHRETAARVVEVLSRDPRIAGVAVAGSWLTGLDEFSDLDLVIAVFPDDEAAVSRERFAIAGSLGPLLSAFSGEHVGEPRLLICLYGPPLLHVDLKLVALPDLARRVDEPHILWQREDLLTRALAGTTAVYPRPDLQWIEDRFWIWVHYGALKIGRGELFETIDFLGFLRARVLGPLLLERAGLTPAGVRRIEERLPEVVPALAATVPAHDRASCGRALLATIALYRELREGHPLERRSTTEAAAIAYFENLL